MKLILKNRNKVDCSVVAAYNASVICKIKTTYKEVEKIAKACGYSSKAGMYPFQFHSLLRKLNIPAKKIKPKSFAGLKRRIFSGKIFIILYTRLGKHNGHIIMAFRSDHDTISIINSEKKINTWNKLVSDTLENGMKSLYVFQISP